MFIGAYWGSRQESRLRAAERIASLLQSLVCIDARFSDWYLKGHSSELADSNRLSPSTDVISTALKTNNRDVDGAPIDELGFSLGLWNGLESFPCGLTVRCGVSSNVVTNAVVFQLPSQNNVLAVLGEGVLRQMLLSVVTAFDPTVAVLTSHEYLKKLGGGLPASTGGWLVYRRDSGDNKLEVNGVIGQI